MVIGFLYGRSFAVGASKMSAPPLLVDDVQGAAIGTERIPGLVENLLQQPVKILLSRQGNTVLDETADMPGLFLGVRLHTLDHSGQHRIESDIVRG